MWEDGGKMGEDWGRTNQKMYNSKRLLTIFHMFFFIFYFLFSFCDRDIPSKPQRGTEKKKGGGVETVAFFLSFFFFFFFFFPIIG